MSTERTLSTLIDLYEREYLPHKAAKTQYQERLLYRWLRQELGGIVLTDLSPLILKSWRDSLRGRYAPGTIRRYMVSLSAVLTVAVDQLEWLEKHPMRFVSKPSEPPGRERSLTPDEQARLLAACRQSGCRQLYMAVILALATGARKNELLSRQWTDVDLTRGLLSIPRAKMGGTRAVPLVQKVSNLLRQHRAQHPGRFVFPQTHHDRPVYLDCAWRNAVAKAKLGDFRFHDLRHSAASHLALSGASLREIAEVLGHRSLKQTMKYTHLVEPHTRGVLETMSQQFLGNLPTVLAGGPSLVPGPPSPVQDLPAVLPADATIVPAGHTTAKQGILDALQQVSPAMASVRQLSALVGKPADELKRLLSTLALMDLVERPARGYYRAKASASLTIGASLCLP